jgi:hypothetical protein
MPVIKKCLLVAVVVLAIAGMTFWTSCDVGPVYYETTKVVNSVEETDAKLQGQINIEVKTTETTIEVKETLSESKVKGETYETEKFSILVPEGWEAKDLPTEGGVQVVITKNKDAMQLSVGGEPPNYTEDIPDAATFCKKQIEYMAKSLNGTAPEEITMFGIKFFKTTYTLDGTDQTIFYGDKSGGDIVMMVMAGKDHQNNVEIKAILESIKFK